MAVGLIVGIFITAEQDLFHLCIHAYAQRVSKQTHDCVYRDVIKEISACVSVRLTQYLINFNFECTN